MSMDAAEESAYIAWCEDKEPMLLGEFIAGSSERLQAFTDWVIANQKDKVRNLNDPELVKEFINENQEFTVQFNNWTRDRWIDISPC